MKKILNRKIDNEGKELYFSFVVKALALPENPNNGANFEEMMRVGPILTKVKNALDEDELLIEESEHEVIAAAMKRLPFQNNSMVVLDMLNDIINAETVQVTEVE